MKQLSKFKKSRFYITLVCNFWTIISFWEMVSTIIITSAIYQFLGEGVPLWLYWLQLLIGIGYFFYANYGMVGSYPKRYKLYNILVESIETDKPFKKSMVFEMMHSRCESHVIRTIERNFGIKLY